MAGGPAQVWQAMSAFGGKTDMPVCIAHVCFWPKADMHGRLFGKSFRSAIPQDFCVAPKGNGYFPPVLVPKNRTAKCDAREWDGHGRLDLRFNNAKREGVRQCPSAEKSGSA